MPKQDWRTGKGYPTEKSSLDEWQFEFLRRGPNGLKGFPHFKIDPNFKNEGGSVEFFRGPARISIQDDGSLLDSPDSSRSNATHMVIQFHLDQDIDAQLSRARTWLIANQKARFKAIGRKRISKYQHYLRAFDAHTGGASHSEIASVLYPPKNTPEAGAKLISNDLRAARKLISEGIPTGQKRK